MSIRPKRILSWLAALALGIGLTQTYAPAQGIAIPNSFTIDTIADPDQVNANFAALAAAALNRNGGTLGGTLNLNGQTLSGAATASGAWTFSSAGTAVAVTNNVTVGGTLGVTGATTLGDLRGTAETITATGTVNDQALGATTTVLRLNNATLLTLTGFTGGAAGRMLIVESVGAGDVVFSHQTGSSAANQLLNFATSGGTPLAAGSGMAMFVYDGTASRWRLVRHEQGGWITPTFAAGNFTGGAGTWTLAGGDVSTFAYRLSGRTLTVALYLATTTVGGATASLSISNVAFGGFTVTKSIAVPIWINDNGTKTTGYVQGAAGGTTLVVSLTSEANFGAGADTSSFRGETSFEVN